MTTTATTPTIYLTMNRFRIKPDGEETFETIWRNRESHLPEVPGFVSFHLLKGPLKDGVRLYASHTVWESEQHFKDWTRSEAFRAAHANAGQNREIYAGPAELEIFETVPGIAAVRG